MTLQSALDDAASMDRTVTKKQLQKAFVNVCEKHGAAGATILKRQLAGHLVRVSAAFGRTSRSLNPYDSAAHTYIDS